MIAYENRGAGRVRSADETAERRRSVRAFWRHCDYATPGTPAALYLARRGLPWLMGREHIRFHPDCRHPGGATLPALMALVHAGEGSICACHRTFLTPDGHKAKADPVKASYGPIAGGAIRLHPAAPEMVIGEGLETTASAGLLLGLPAWSAIAAGNLARSLVLPPGVRRVVVAADADKAGIAAANAAALRWRREGRVVRIATPDVPGMDFNDVLQARLAAAAVEVAHG